MSDRKPRPYTRMELTSPGKREPLDWRRVLDTVEALDAEHERASYATADDRQRARELGYEKGWADCREAAAKVADDAGCERWAKIAIARCIRALTPAATTGERPPAEPPSCAWCGKHLVRGPVGGGHFDWLECKCTAPAEPSGATCKTCNSSGPGTFISSHRPCPDCTTPSPARPKCPANPDGQHRAWHDDGPFTHCRCGVELKDARPSEAACNDCKGASDYVKARCMTCGGTGRTGAR